MKLSNYNINFSINDEEDIIYNTFARKYITYNKNEQESINNLLNNLNKGSYEIEEVEYLGTLLKKGIVIQDDVDELDIIEYMENSSKYGDDLFRLQIIPTMNCNFRCAYCYEDHKNLRLDNFSAEKIVKLVNKISAKTRKLNVSWFGGEPLLEFDRIKDLTSAFLDICKQNHCIYSAMITTNGYLLNKETIQEFKRLKIENTQITIDGEEDYHNKKRQLINGQGTFAKIRDNILDLVDNEIKVTIRVNINEENYGHINDVLSIIPKEKRYLATIDMYNIFQNENRLNLYPLLSRAIESGYNYNYIKNSQYLCELCLKNGLVITPDARIIPCTIWAEKGYEFGHLGDNGEIIIKNKGLYYRLKNESCLKNEGCTNCKQLPMCIGSCKFRRYLEEGCTANTSDGLSIKERVLLHYQYDLISDRKGR